MQDARRYIGQDAILHLCALICRDVNERHGVERVSRIGRAVRIDRVVGVAVVSDDNRLVVGFVGSRHDLIHALVDGYHSLFDCFVDTRVADHIAVGKIDNDKVVFVCANGFDELIFHLESTHFGLQIIGCYFRRGYEYAVFTFIGRFASAIEEKRDVGIFLRLGRVELLQALAAQIFAERILYVLFGEENVDAFERCVVGRHAIKLQSRYGLHTFFGHILLREDGGQLLGAVVAIIEENNDIVGLDAPIDLGVN